MAELAALPWQNLLQQLQGDEPDLPHTGAALSSFVNVLLKTSEEGDTKESLSKFVHQALVRRDVVISLIENAVERGHRAYRHLDMVRVRQKAQELPDNAVPAHILKLLPCDDTLDKIQIQKAATPAPGRSQVEDAAQHLAQLKPNGVVLEQSSYDEADINAQRVAAIRNFASRLNVLEPDAVNSEDEGLKWPDASAGTQMPENDAEVPRIKRQKLSIGDA